MRQLICLASAALLTLCSASTLLAQAAEVGDRVRVVQQTDTLTGRLVSLQGNMLVLRGEGGLLRELRLDADVEAFHHHREYSGPALLVGAGIGWGIGLLVAGTHIETVCTTAFLSGEVCREEDVKDGGPIAIGAGIGLLTALALTFPRANWIPIDAHAMRMDVSPTLNGAVGFHVTLPTNLGGAR